MPSRSEKLKADQAALEDAHQKAPGGTQSAGRRGKIRRCRRRSTRWKNKKEDAERDLKPVRLRWQEELVAKDKALKEAQLAVAPQEAELRKRFAAEEETLTRQSDALKTRLRALERDLTRTRENIDKTENEHASVMQALESDYRGKEEALRQRSVELEARLRKRLEERRVALEAFLAMKKDEETRVQTALKTKEKERAELSTRLQTLPQELETVLKDKKTAVQKRIRPAARAHRGPWKRPSPRRRAKNPRPS